MPDIEQHLRKAFEEGKFDHLPGKGKPLHLDENPLEDPEWRLAFHVLRSSGFSLPWIEMRQEIESRLSEAREALRRAWEWHQSTSPEEAAMRTETWQAARETFRQEIAAINKRIADYNLQVPLPHFQLLKLNYQHEIEKLTEKGLSGG